MFDDASAWALPSEPSSGDLVKEAIQKDQTVK